LKRNSRKGIHIKKIVLITGASSGIGNACADFLVKNGFIVYAGTRTPEKINITHKNLYPIKLNLTNFQQLNNVISEIYKKHNRIDILINNAGYGFVSAVEYATEEEMKKQFDINVFSIFRVCKAVIPYMKNKKTEGIIINIGSYFGKVSFPLFAFYSASKFAIEGLTDALRYELKELNIRVHSVLPGFTKSDFTNSNLIKNIDTFKDNTSYAKILDTIPQLMTNIDNGSNPKIVAKTILDTINNIYLDTRVYVENESRKISPIKDELINDEKMIYRFYKLEIENTNIDANELQIAMDAKEILLKNYVNPPKIENLAKLCATNKTKLNNVFQKVYKITIANYIKNLRLEKAYALLEERTLNIGEVAKEVGYMHQGNFTKLFFIKYRIYPKDILSQKC
jgi:short-subunit dehydrogenase/AraC-like DNA-binding protein